MIKRVLNNTKILINDPRNDRFQSHFEKIQYNKKKKNVKLNMNLINLFSFYVYYKLNSKQNINNQLMI